MRKNFASEVKMDNKLRGFMEKLPDKPDILGRKNFQNAAVFVPFLKIDNEYHLLFEKRANHIRQGGEISFPGGMIDAHRKETACKAAIRETQEELGVEKDKFQIYKQFHTLVTAHGTIIEIFVGELFARPAQLLINKNEVEKVFTVPLSFFLQTEPEKYEMKVILSPYETNQNNEKKILFPAEKLAIPQHYRETWSRKNTPVYVYHFQSEVIWGMTAQIVYELVFYLQ
jgi:8-oxo-dGTP pyrophosphatase MutT (NUDIX family)